MWVYKVDLEDQLIHISKAVKQLREEVNLLRGFINGNNVEMFKIYYEKKMIEQLLKRNVQESELDSLQLKKDILAAYEKILASKLLKEFMLKGVLKKHANEDK
jgi:hypothetical protein